MKNMLQSLFTKQLFRLIIGISIATSASLFLLVNTTVAIEPTPMTTNDADAIVAEVQGENNKDIIGTVLYEEAHSYQEQQLQILEANPVEYLQYKASLEGLQQYEIDTLNRIMYCESKYDPYAYNASSGASGLFQFLSSSWQAWGNGGNVFDVSDNVDAALTYYSAAGTAPWVCK